MKKLIFLSLGSCCMLWFMSVAGKSLHAQRSQQDSSFINVIYGSNTNAEGKKQNLTMNVYLPPNAVAGKKYPMVLLMHGGTFLTGNKENMAGPCKQFADSGFVAVTINYRKGWAAATALAGCSGIDINSLMLANYRAVQDARAALRCLAHDAEKYQIDTNWMFIGGSSAGGIIALDVAYLDQKTADEKFAPAVKELGPLDNASNFYTTKFNLKGICNMWGALPDSTLINKRTALPTILYHGTADLTVPYDKGTYIPNCSRLPELYGSACIYRQTLAAGQVAVLNTSIGGKHGPVEFTRALMVSNTACFFHKVINGAAKSGSYTNTQPGCR